MRDVNDVDQSTLQELREGSWLYNMARVLLVMLICAIMLIFAVNIPLRVAVAAKRDLFPLRLELSSTLWEVLVDAVGAYFLLPATLKYLQPIDTLSVVLKWWFFCIGSVIGIE